MIILTQKMTKLEPKNTFSKQKSQFFADISETVKDNSNMFALLERTQNSAFFGTSMIILTQKVTKLEQKTNFL